VRAIPHEHHSSFYDWTAAAFHDDGGHSSRPCQLPTEIAMTLVIGAASLVGMITCVRWRAKMRPLFASGVLLLCALLQYQPSD
jgi:hypothetical protein